MATYQRNPETGQCPEDLSATEMRQGVAPKTSVIVLVGAIAVAVAALSTALWIVPAP